MIMISSFLLCLLSSIATSVFLLIVLKSEMIVVNSFGAQFLCNHIPGLTPKQRIICETSPDAIAIIGEGTKLGISECQHQFRFSRWNCTPMGMEQNYGHVVVLGSREAAFLYAITSSGVTYSITQACGRGNISTCGCAPPTTSPTSRFSLSNDDGSSAAANWRWGGCSADVDYATKLTRKFLDAREIEGDARSLMNLHNNKAGRKIVHSTLETECKCHGVSGSCTLKTCWLKLPNFREIGDKLVEKYQKARPVIAVQSSTKQAARTRRSLMLLVRPKSRYHLRHHHSHQRHVYPQNEPNADHQDVFTSRRYSERKRSLKDTTGKPRRTELVYLEQSPNYCEEDMALGSLGTRGRRCLKNGSTGGFPLESFANRSKEESCDILCCGRGYNTHQIYHKWKCGCKFRWCCEVNCQNCQERIEVYTCN